jgi:hypothetical protein
MERLGSERHAMNGAGMHTQETAEISARVKEIEGKLDMLVELARRIAERAGATSSSVR